MITATQRDKTASIVFALLVALAISTSLAAFQTNLLYVALAPFAVIIAAVAIINFRWLYYLLLISIPLSIEYSFSPSLATDLPDEPLMVGLMFITLLYLLLYPKSLPRGYLFHPLLILVGLHLFWTFVTMFTSVSVFVSLKVFLSKLWYVVTFAILTPLVLRTADDLKKAFWCIYIPLTLLIIQVIIRHGMIGFSFEDINDPMPPFFRNHVNYAAIVTIVLPLIWLARSWYSKESLLRKLLNASLLLYVTAIYLSYTRTCYVALMILPVVVFVIKKGWMKTAVGAALTGLAALVIFLMNDNRFLDFAPKYEETIIHDDFGKHLSSTFEGKDVSSMERVYRWVAISRMWKDRPVFGVGPGNFYPSYMQYTVLSFITYVSDNPERSTAHNYFLLLLAEQGVPGVLFFLILSAAIFIYGEKIYHSLSNEAEKKTALALLCVLAVVYVNLLLSDLLESDKVGPFFFIAVALLVAMDIKQRLLETQG